MNKRIEELAEQVDLLGDFTPTKIPGRYAGTINITDIEKFAELIVQTCIREIRHKSLELLDVELVDHYEQRLKTYFGVEA